MRVCDEGEVNHNAVDGAIALVASGKLLFLSLPSRRGLKLSRAWDGHVRGRTGAKEGESRETGLSRRNEEKHKH